MSTAILLLMTAMSLLTQLQNSPNVTPEFKAQVESVATYAISFAEQTIHEESLRIIASAPQSETPDNSQTTTSIPVSVCAETPLLSLATSTDLSISGRYKVSVNYSTGCSLNPSTTYNYYADEWRNGSGVIGTESLKWSFTVNALPDKTPFKITVGSLTKEL